MSLDAVQLKGEGEEEVNNSYNIFQDSQKQH